MKQDKSMKALQSILVRDRTQYEKKITKNMNGGGLRAVNSSEITGASVFGRQSLFVNLR